jgi:arginine-tRNA-protein transferase
MPLPPPVAVRLTTLPPQQCNYLPDRVATTRAFRIDQLSSGMYERFMNAGFRRSGTILYQPACENCQSCIPIRVPVKDFCPTKSQRRSLRLNSDLSITQAAPQLTDEKFELYRNYLIGWHDRDPARADDRAALEEFLYRSPVHSTEFSYRDPQGKLIGVGIADISTTIFSSVYFYFDPQERRRGLGTFSALYEIQHCQQANIPFYYLGFWVEGCQSMQYKSHFKPSEILGPDGIWRLLVEPN